MARTIVVTYGGEDSSFNFSKLDRSKLYGSRKRVILDREGEPCRRAELTDDGSAVIQSGMTAQGYFDDEGNWIQNSDMIGLDPEGNPAPIYDRTVGVPQPLKGPVPPEDLLNTRVQSVYVLSADTMSERLAEALSDGEIFEFPYGYRKDHNQQVGYLVANDEGIFALIGNAAPPQWCELETPVAPLLEEDDGDDFDDDLDFEMF